MGNNERKTIFVVGLCMNRRPRILVADDDELSLVLASDILRSKGYDVVIARNGESAVRLAIDSKPDLILMDMRMPVMAGLEAVRLLKGASDTNAIPVVAMTASAMAGDEERMRQAGCDAYLAKPTTPSQILRAVRQFVSGGGVAMRGERTGSTYARIA